MSESDQQEPRPGWVEAAARLVTVALRSPKAKSGLDTVLRYLDPDYGAQLVQAVVNTEPEVSYAVVGALPDGINIGIEVAAALAREVTSRPTALVHEVLQSLKARIRVRTLGEAVGAVVAKAVAALGEPASPSLTGQFVDGLATGLRAEGLAPGEALRAVSAATSRELLEGLERQLGQDPELAGHIARLSNDLSQLLSSHPQVVEQVLAPLLGPVLEAVARKEHAA
jgi:hypothetical protein